jgi:hypothetical protein
MQAVVHQLFTRDLVINSPGENGAAQKNTSCGTEISRQRGQKHLLT